MQLISTQRRDAPVTKAKSKPWSNVESRVGKEPVKLQNLGLNLEGCT